MVEGCGPSKQVQTYVKKHNLTRFKFVNVESYPQFVLEQIIKGLPMIVVKDDDNILAAYVGYSEDVLNEIKELLEGINDRF